MEIKTFYKVYRGGVLEKSTFPDHAPDSKDWQPYGESYNSYFDEAGYPCKPNEAFTVIEYYDFICEE